MALPIAAIAGSVAAAAYLDAKFLIRHDLETPSLTSNQAAAVACITERTKQDRMLIYRELDPSSISKLPFSLYTDDIEAHAKRNDPDHIFLIFEGRQWTYKQFFDDLQRVGNWLMKDLKIEKGELVAINGANSPEYLMLWYALEGIGACISFINCHLTSQPLVHSLKLCESRLMITDRDNQVNVQPCEGDLKAAGVETIYYDRVFFASLSDATPLPQSRRSGIKSDDVRCLIYTSGTTGLPKGTMLLTGREINTARRVSLYLRLKPGDRMYTALPLYHGAGHGLCITPSIYAGSTVVLSRKFSHKTFWPEVSASRAHIIQYVGEMCRFLVTAPYNPAESTHQVQMAWGNGMRPDVWEVFRQRFNIPVINELYAATDGLGSSFNYNKGDFGRNAIGLRGLLWRLRDGKNEVRVKIDVDTEDIRRDKNGFAMKVDVNEPGEVLHKVDPAMMAAAFAGYYKNQTASEKRWIRDVFKKGDLWFRSGDVMRQDGDGRVYFVDRLGDTFRWKSENVSTNEVSDVLGQFEQIHEANVYGIQVPHADGRCGCAAVVMASGVTVDNFDFEGLARHVISMLPRYAVPIFLRMTSALQYTGTFKIQKGVAKREGVDLDLIEKSGSGDKVYWLPANGTSYMPFRRKDWQALQNGSVKL